MVYFGREVAEKKSVGSETIQEVVLMANKVVVLFEPPLEKWILSAPGTDRRVTQLLGLPRMRLLGWPKTWPMACPGKYPLGWPMAEVTPLILCWRLYAHLTVAATDALNERRLRWQGVGRTANVIWWTVP